MTGEGFFYCIKIGICIDIGCGTGLELDCIFNEKPELHAVGIDLSDQMLAALRRKHPNQSLTLIQGDYFLHDFGSACFDAAVSFETLHHFTAAKKMKLFKKLYRALVPGGVYLECDYFASSEAIENLTFTEYRRRCARDKIAPGTFVHFDTPLTLEHEMQALKSAGFSAVEHMGFLPGDCHTAMIRAEKQYHQ